MSGPLDDDTRRALVGQAHRSKDLQTEVGSLAHDIDALLGDEFVASPVPIVSGEPLGRPLPSFDASIAANTAYLADRGLGGLTLDDCLTPEQLDQVESLEGSARLRWTLEDFATVGLAGAVGVFATLFDDKVDAVVRARLSTLKDSELIQRWERDARSLPIDYTGRDFGGPGHRVRSAGHDVGRPFEALSQIRDGQFRGWTWDYGKRTLVTQHGLRGSTYVPVDDPVEALVLWLKHLVADFVTSTSLPLPGWSRLYELPYRDVRKMAHDLYLGSRGAPGLNLRSMILSKTFPVITTELLVRVRVHWRAHELRQDFALLPTEERLRDEMLLAGHVLTGAGVLGKVAWACHTSGPLGIRHLNLPVLVQAGWLGWKVVQGTLGTRPVTPSWDELCRGLRLPWELEEISHFDRTTL